MAIQIFVLQPLWMIGKNIVKCHKNTMERIPCVLQKVFKLLADLREAPGMRPCTQGSISFIFMPFSGEI